jgi:hypothetical protein
MPARSPRGRIRTCPDSVTIDASLGRNAGAALVFLLLLAAAVTGFDPAVDLSAGRLPFTVLYLLALASTAVAVVLRGRLLIGRVGEGCVVSSQMRCAGRLVRERRTEIGAAAAVGVRRGGGPFAPYRLEITRAGEAGKGGPRTGAPMPIVVDSGMLKSDLEAAGRVIADLLGVPFEAATEAR